MIKLSKINEHDETIESLRMKLKSSQTNCKRLRFEYDSQERRYYVYKERIEFLEKQLQTTNNILQSVSSLLQIKVKELNKNDEVKQ